MGSDFVEAEIDCCPPCSPPSSFLVGDDAFVSIPLANVSCGA